LPLPKEIVDLFNNPVARKTLSTIDENNTVHAAPFASLNASSDGFMLTLTQLWADETPRRLKYMKEAGKEAVVQFVDVEKNIRIGYSIRCKVGDALTSGPIYDKISEITQQRFGMKPKAVWTFYPVSYKIHTPGPERGKIVEL